MRTKTLLLTAALSAAGVASSLAQVYSVNAVGYVVKPLVSGFNLISNPLRNTEANGNRIRNLLTGVPAGTAVYRYNNATGSYQIANYSAIFGDWDQAAIVDQDLLPGQGMFVRLPAGVTHSLTFVGEVVQGQNLTVPLPVGFSIVSSIVPQEGTASALGYVPAAGDSLYFWNEATQGYVIRNFSAIFGDWDSPLPVVEVGEAFFSRRLVAGTWTRSFNVNGQ
jgi:hypothetical protein